MPRRPRQPTGERPGGGGQDQGAGAVERYREALKKLREEFRGLLEGKRKLTDVMRTFGKLLKDEYQLLVDKLRPAYREAAADATTFQKATEETSKAVAGAKTKFDALRFAQELVGGVLVGVVLKSFKSFADFLSNVLAPDLTLITGGYAKQTAAAEALEKQVFRVATSLERGQERAFSLRKTLQDLVAQGLKRVDDSTAEVAGELGQMGSQVLTVAGILAQATAGLVGFGIIAKDTIPLLQKFGAVTNFSAVANLKNFGDLLKLVGGFLKAGFVAGLQGAGIALAAFGTILKTGVIALFTTLPGLVTLAVGALTVLTAKLYLNREEARRSADSYAEYIAKLKEGSRAERELASALEASRKELELQARAIEARREAERARERGDVRAAVAATRAVELAELELRHTRELEELNKKIRESKELQNEHAQREQRTAVARRQQAERIAFFEAEHLNAIEEQNRNLDRQLEIRDRMRALEEASIALDESASRNRAESLRQEVELARARGTSVREISALEAKLTDEALKQRDSAIEATRLEIEAAKDRVETEKNRLDAIRELQEGKGLLAQDTNKEIAKLAEVVSLDKQRLTTSARLSERAEEILAKLEEQRAALAQIEKQEDGVARGPRIEQLKKDIELNQQRLEQLGAEDKRYLLIADRLKENERILAQKKKDLEDIAKAVPALQKDWVDVRDAIAAGVTEIDRLEQTQKQLIENATILNQLTAERLGLEREEREIRRGIAEIEEQIARQKGDFDPEREFQKARSKLVQLRPLSSEKNLEEAEKLRDKILRLSEELGDREKEIALKVAKRVEKDRLALNLERQTAIETREKEVADALERDLKPPMEELASLSLRVGDNILSWKGHIEQVLTSLRAYREEFIQLARDVERAPQEVALRGPGPAPAVVPTTGGTVLTPPTSPSPLPQGFRVTINPATGVRGYTNL